MKNGHLNIKHKFINWVCNLCIHNSDVYIQLNFYSLMQKMSERDRNIKYMSIDQMCLLYI